MTTRYTHFESPLGRLRLFAAGEALVGLYFPQHRHAPEQTAAYTEGDAFLRDVAQQLRAYFASRLKVFHVATAASGTAFQERVWTELTRIPWGKTRSYGELAASVRSPDASRAVGLANARNPISIVVPCHRVIAKSGALTGYAGGLQAKTWLLKHEGALREA